MIDYLYTGHFNGDLEDEVVNDATRLGTGDDGKHVSKPLLTNNSFNIRY